ncbi:MAG TPA: RNA polymerase sigma factor [Thermodesulfovibrionales bacterium]|nr:RNA polymerase sigma factor [Thermodesulfovibrionales bacterium]
MDEDTRLIEEYLAGSEAAIEELVRRHQRQLYAFIYRMVTDMEETKDLTQKAFISAVKGLKHYKAESSFKTWLYRIALNTCHNHFKQNRHEKVELEENIPSNQAGTLTNLIDKEKKEEIRRGLNTLPERQRLAVVLRTYNGLSCEETAKVMGCSEGAVKSHYHLGVRKLREIFRGRGYEIKS